MSLTMHAWQYGTCFLRFQLFTNFKSGLRQPGTGTGVWPRFWMGHKIQTGNNKYRIMITTTDHSISNPSLTSTIPAAEPWLHSGQQLKKAGIEDRVAVSGDISVLTLISPGCISMHHDAVQGRPCKQNLHPSWVTRIPDGIIQRRYGRIGYYNSCGFPTFQMFSDRWLPHPCMGMHGHMPSPSL